MNSPIIIHLERESFDQQWGFHLQGGNDCPSHYRFNWYVNPNTLAHINGLNAGDQVISINGRNVTNLTHQDVKMEIARSGNELELTVIKGAINQQSISTPQSFSQTKIGSVHQMPNLRVVKNNSTVSNYPQTHLSSNHNRTAMQFNERTEKSMNRQSSDYTHEIPEHLRPKVTNFESSSAYNRDPLQREMWRPKAYKSQTGNLIDEIKGNNLSQSTVNCNDNIYYKPSPTYQAVMNYEQQKHIPYSSEGKISRSFRALEEDLLSVQGTSKTPKSIFDQRRQQ
ncbi:unnamed protein product [Rotaria sordida]|uniref:PDZ domain-containing protein n=1 Tax=Rotaria sordida TaxID=392033 RepID=A0A813ZC93_9BILA|nr:unnamed protein product [Rotaria sordida]CAF0897397.1 unnamed protein product [Rotaria sordida]